MAYLTIDDLWSDFVKERSREEWIALVNQMDPADPYRTIMETGLDNIHKRSLNSAYNDAMDIVK